jgi:hypothetical protein
VAARGNELDSLFSKMASTADRIEATLLRNAEQRTRRIKQHRATIQPLVDWQNDRMINREAIVSSYNIDLDNTSPKKKIELIANILHDFAMDRSMYPIPPQSAIYKEMDDDLADWLLRFIADPLGTSPNHAALVLDTQSNAKKGDMQIYVRMRKERNYWKDLEEFMEQFPAFAPDIEPKILQNQGDEVWSHYIGQTIRQTPAGRLEEDDGARVGKQITSLFKRWMEATKDRPYSSYEVISWRESWRDPVNPDSDTLDVQNQWLSTPRYWVKEYLLVLASGKSGFNSAAGGLPQVMHLPSPDVLRILSKVHHARNLPTAQPDRNQDPASADSLPEEMQVKVRNHFRTMVSTFEQLEANEQSRGIISPSAQEIAVENLLHTRDVLLIGKDITVQDAKGVSSWWNDYAGPSPKLWHWLVDWTRCDPKNLVPR